MNDIHQDSTQEAPTILLLHGAFAESASWNRVIADLHQRGRRVVAVANPLRGLQQDAAYLRSIIDGFPGPVVVAGHSYGGSVMSEAAAGSTTVEIDASHILSVVTAVGGGVLRDVIAGEDAGTRPRRLRALRRAGVGRRPRGRNRH